MSEIRLQHAEQRIGNLEETLRAFMLKSTEVETRLAATVEHLGNGIVDLKKSFLSFEHAFEKRRIDETERMKREMDINVKAAVEAHRSKCADRIKKPLTKTQIAAWGTLLTTLMGGVGYIFSVVFK